MVGVVLLLPRVVDVCQNQDSQDYGGFSGLGRCVASFYGFPPTRE